MAQHDHLLLPFLALILLILSLASSSRVPQSPALFSENGQFITGGQNLSFGDLTLALFPNCSLQLYKGDSLSIDFYTGAAKAKDCKLSINKSGQLVLESGDEPPTNIPPICDAGKNGSYALLFVDGNVGIYGPSIWSNDVSVPSSALIKNGKLRAGVSNNFLVSPKRSMGSTNGNTTIAVNGDASAIITNYCQLVTKNENGEEAFVSHPPTDEPTECFLHLSSVGELLLQYKNGSGLQTQWTGGDYAKYNTYVAVLRYFGRIGVYGLKNYLSACAPLDENIKMVTA